jgi:hypothetical protein
MYPEILLETNGDKNYHVQSHNTYLLPILSVTPSAAPTPPSGTKQSLWLMLLLANPKKY